MIISKSMYARIIRELNFNGRWKIVGCIMCENTIWAKYFKSKNSQGLKTFLSLCIGWKIFSKTLKNINNLVNTDINFIIF